MKKILYVCDRCGLEKESHGDRPARWDALVCRRRESYNREQPESDHVRTYCRDCSGLIEDLLSGFKSTRELCGAVNPGTSRGRGGEVCIRLAGHNLGHESTVDTWCDVEVSA